ncbi:Uncharacterised protein [Mycobacteroides abscessus subsp. abscessus]|nr:Uncharacterised protein [Mycobacteroides abscessus subsp. abscessus]
MAPPITVSSRTGSVQFSSEDGLRNTAMPPAVSHEKPNRAARSAKVGVQRSDIVRLPLPSPCLRCTTE